MQHRAIVGLSLFVLAAPASAFAQTAAPQASSYCDEFDCQSGSLVQKGMIQAVDSSSPAAAHKSAFPAKALPYSCTVWASPPDLDVYLDSLPAAQRKCFSWYVPDTAGPNGVGNYFFLSCPTGGESSPFCGPAAAATPTPTP
jgi:hypothetical protein